MVPFLSVGLRPGIIFAAALLSFLPWIGSHELWTKDEARTALVVKEMLATGDWTLPRVPGGHYGRKPPLYHWLTALGARRGLNETTLRVPAAAAGAGAATLTYLCGAQLASPAVGVVAAAILIASPEFFEWARIGRMETLLVFCTTLSLWGLARWLQFGGRGNAVLFGLGLGLGVLSKGPVGLLPLAVAVLGVVVYSSRPGRLRELVPGLACALALPLAWLGPAALTATDFTRYAESFLPMVSSELERPARVVLGGAAGLGLGFLPWVLLLPGCLVVLARHRPLSSPLVVVSLGWVIVVLVVFMVLIPPRPVYFLPAYPALALIAAWAWQSAEGNERWWLACPLGFGTAAVIVAGIVSAVWPPTLRIRAIPLLLPPQSALITSGVLLAVGLGALRLQRRGSSAAAIVVFAGGVVATLLTLDVLVRAPFYNHLYPMRAVAGRLEARIPPNAEVGFTDLSQITALAVHLSRPVKQLSAPQIDGRSTSPIPRYVLLTEFQFVELVEKWSLQRMDEVLIGKRRYVLATRRELPAYGRDLLP